MPTKPLYKVGLEKKDAVNMSLFQITNWIWGLALVLKGLVHNPAANMLPFRCL